MKVLRWIIFAPLFFFYTTLPQYYAEKFTRYGWSIHSTTNGWIVNIFSFLLKFFIPILVWAFFSVGSMYLVKMAPNTKIGGIILISIFGPMIIISWVSAWGSLDKVDVLFDIQIFMVLLAAAIGSFEPESNKKISH